MLFATPGRSAASFAAVAQDLHAHGGTAEAISAVSMDMSQAFQPGAARHCPQAQVSFDPFHVVDLASRALDQVRRAKTKPDLRGSRWALLRDARGWNGAQLNLMHWLQRSGLKTPRAWRLKICS